MLVPFWLKAQLRMAPEADASFLGAIVLACASSLDNLTVGISLGLGRFQLPWFTNAVVAVANAVG